MRMDAHHPVAYLRTQPTPAAAWVYRCGCPGAERKREGEGRGEPRGVLRAAAVPDRRGAALAESMLGCVVDETGGARECAAGGDTQSQPDRPLG